MARRMTIVARKKYPRLDRLPKYTNRLTATPRSNHSNRESDRLIPSRRDEGREGEGVREILTGGGRNRAKVKVVVEEIYGQSVVVQWRAQATGTRK